ncbi:MAG: aldo/keto reductase, partial [Dehalococcoidia bacterium]
EMAMQHGVNHFDVSPRYGLAEIRMAPWVEKYRKDIFLACKTADRSKTAAWESIKRSLDRLHTDHFDLYQLHMVSDFETLKVVLGPDGALEAFVEAKNAGLIRYIGIAGHRTYVQIEALNCFDFDTVLFPVNAVQAAYLNDYTDFKFLLQVAQKKDVGTIAIKAIAKQLWKPGARMYRTWYEPFTQQDEIDKATWYTLSQGVSRSVLPSDIRLWPLVIDAAERFKPLDNMEQETIVSVFKIYGSPIFPSNYLIP